MSEHFSESQCQDSSLQFCFRGHKSLSKGLVGGEFASHQNMASELPRYPPLDDNHELNTQYSPANHPDRA